MLKKVNYSKFKMHILKLEIPFVKRVREMAMTILKHNT